ncbi:hypothetical protein [Parachlamydia sp. AcF125]|uniref:hypothetical protein n=1 Tax=Parachlamydia sp. AcF125 TaxID=2795736 RepID=UPI001BC9D9CE|nr:hypothetical protein [Parachlamydia sp. AcF125]
MEVSIGASDIRATLGASTTCFDTLAKGGAIDASGFSFVVNSTGLEEVGWPNLNSSTTTFVW